MKFFLCILKMAALLTALVITVSLAKEKNREPVRILAIFLLLIIQHVLEEAIVRL